MSLPATPQQLASFATRLAELDRVNKVFLETLAAGPVPDFGAACSVTGTTIRISFVGYEAVADAESTCSGDDAFATEYLFRARVKDENVVVARIDVDVDVEGCVWRDKPEPVKVCEFNESALAGRVVAIVASGIRHSGAFRASY